MSKSDVAITSIKNR